MNGMNGRDIDRGEEEAAMRSKKTERILDAMGVLRTNAYAGVTALTASLKAAQDAGWPRFTGPDESGMNRAWAERPVRECPVPAELRGQDGSPWWECPLCGKQIADDTGACDCPWRLWLYRLDKDGRETVAAAVNKALAAYGEQQRAAANVESIDAGLDALYRLYVVDE